MYAVRRKDGNQKPFRVGERQYVGAYWKLEEAITPEHEFAAEHGALAIVEVSSLSDPKLMPFPAENPADLSEIATAVDPAELLQALSEKEARIVALESQVLQLEGAIHGHEAQIAALEADKAECAAQFESLSAHSQEQQAAIDALTHQLQEVRTSVETFPVADASDAPSAQHRFETGSGSVPDAGGIEDASNR